MMLFVLSAGLTLFLLIGVMMMFNPHLISPALAERWMRNHKYWRQ